MPSSHMWSVIAVTCPSTESAYAVQKELEIRQQKGRISKDTIVLAVDDPRSLIGSGSATLNALVLIVQHLSMKAGLQGRQSPLAPCGSAFITLPVQLNDNKNPTNIQSEICCNVDLLLLTLSNTVCVDTPPGVWVTSCDMILSVPQKTEIDWSDSYGLHVISVPATPEYAKNHGIIKIGDERTVEDLFYLPTDEEVEKCLLDDGRVPVLPVIIFLSEEVSKRFYLLHAQPPLENCTFVGLDSGGEPIEISFLFDILLCMVKNVSKEDFVSGERSTSYGGRKNRLHSNHRSPVSRFYMRNAREALWNHLRNVPLKTIFLRNANYKYLFPNGACYQQIIRTLSSSKSSYNIAVRDSSTTVGNACANKNEKMVARIMASDTTVEISSTKDDDIKIGRNSVIMHCKLQGQICIGSNCFLAGLNQRFEPKDARLTIPCKTVVQRIRLKESSDAVKGGYCETTIVFGIGDNLTVSYKEPGSSFCNKAWEELFQRTGITPQDLWHNIELDSPPCLLRAKLFPVSRSNSINENNVLWWLAGWSENTHSTDFLSRWRASKRLSIGEIMTRVSFGEEFSWRRYLFFEIGSNKIKESVLKESSTFILPFLTNCVNEGFHNEILSALDELACLCDRPTEVARMLSHIADVLSIMAGLTGGLRSGPAKNPAWTKAVDLLEKGKLAEGVKELAVQRDRWKGSSLLLTRCARHYEGAEQTLIRQAVLHTKQLVDIRDDPDCNPVGIGTWVTAEAPARVDLSGGWSDTPPITYEHGGTVTNVAIKIDGKRPIGARIRKIPEYKLVLVLRHREESLTLTCRTLEDIKDHSNPSAPGALLKSAFLCTKTVYLPSESSLETQLQEHYGCGFELHAWSNAPQGSGLGTSSILGGVICAAILRSLGRCHDHITLVHLVIHLEQMLTTGGGWQDQVGGLIPGVKMTTSAPNTPIRVEPRRLNISRDTLSKFVEHTALIYTGKTRLAKDILQDAVRRWNARHPNTVQNVDDLTTNARACAKAWETGNLVEMGRCLNKYREQKKIMAPGCENDEVREIIDAIEPHLHGCCLAGAGGGGFLFAITRRPNIHDELTNILKDSTEGTVWYTVHRVEVDNEGLTVQVDEQTN